MAPPHHSTPRALLAYTLTLAIAALAISLYAVPHASARSIGPWSQSTAADFGAACSTLTDTIVSNSAGGEIRLAATLEDYFDGTTLDTGRWNPTRFFAWGGADPMVSNGLLTLDGSSVRSQSAISAATRVIEFRARLRAGSSDTGWGAFGLGRQNDPGGGGPSLAHRLWETDDVNQLFAVARDGSGLAQFPQVAGVDLSQFHTYRIEWKAASTAYSIDGTQRVTLTASSSAPAWAWLYTYNPGSIVEVDWVRVAPYVSTSGTYVSCPIDSEEVTNWGNLTWSADTPAGTSIAFETRTASDGSTWSAWSTPITTSGSPITSPADRYLQYRITLSTTNPTVSPEVRQVLVTAETGWRHTTQADFRDCGEFQLSDTTIASVEGGEIRLASVLEDYFDDPVISTTRWITDQIYFYGGAFPPTVTNGILALNASYVRSVVTMTQPLRMFEARAQLQVPPQNTNYGDIGFGREPSPGCTSQGCPPGHNRLFITNDADLVQANARNGSVPPTNVDLATLDPSQWHVYRIEYGQSSTNYYVDGSFAASITLASTYTPYVWLYTQEPGSTILVDWARVEYYPSPSGQYQSCSVDAGQTTGWGFLSWSGSTPAGTGMTFETRTSADNSAWSAWAAVGGSGEINSPPNRYIQYQTTLTTSDSLVSPQIDWVSVSTTGALPPIISNIAGVAPTSDTALISWQTDQPSLGQVQYGTTMSLGTWLTGTEYLTSHAFTIGGLQPNTLYYYAVYATNGDGLASQSSLSSFTTPGGQFSHTTPSDFGVGSSCAVLTDTIVSNVQGGEVRLRSTVLEDYFSSSEFDTSQWVGRTINPPGGIYTPTIAGGVAQVVDVTTGARIRTIGTLLPGQTIEFRARFEPRRYQHIGFSDFADQWAVFSTGGGDLTGADTYAWTSNSGDGGDVYTTLTNLQAGVFYNYRIDWAGSQVRYYVDNTLVASHTISIAGPMYVHVSNFDTNDLPIYVDWIRLLSSPANGSFVGCTIDAGQNVNWDAIFWTASVPGSTGLNANVRTSLDGLDWSSWTGSLTTSGSGFGSPLGRYLQYRLNLSSSDTARTPEVYDVTVTYSLNTGPTATPTNTPTPSNTPTSTATSTPTGTATNTSTPSNTPTNTATATATPSETPTPSNTPTSTSTNTPTQTNTVTYTPTPSNTPTNTPTATPTPSDTPTSTATYTPTPSNTPTNTATFTPTPSDTPTSTSTYTPTPTDTPTPSDTPTNTVTNTATPSITPTNTATNTPTATSTPTGQPDHREIYIPVVIRQADALYWQDQVSHMLQHIIGILRAL